MFMGSDRTLQHFRTTALQGEVCCVVFKMLGDGHMPTLMHSASARAERRRELCQPLRMPVVGWVDGHRKTAIF